jgi:lycopene beta-cyclase
MARLRPEVPILLIETGNSFGGNHIWSFFDPDVATADRWLVEPLVAKHWPDYEIAFPAQRRTLPTGYNSIRSESLDALIRDRLRPEQYRLGTAITSLAPDRVVMADGATFRAAGVIDARGFGALAARNRAALDLGWQKFVGRELSFDVPHGLDRPIVMDATVDQGDGYRFVYCLPFSRDRMFVEDTYYSPDPALNHHVMGDRIAEYVDRRGWGKARIEREESGALPVAMGGDFDAFWPVGTPARIGVVGGFFHPTTGYSLPDAVRIATVLARQPGFDGAELAALLRSESLQSWRERRFYRLLNKMLFRAAAPNERYRVLEHFYRLDSDVIERFYASRSSLADKVRMMSGRPPVPVGKALAALWK